MTSKSKKNTALKKQFKEVGLFILDILYNAIVIIALVILIRNYLISPFRVMGSSMNDTLHDQNFILINKLSYLIGDIDRGDPVVFLPPAMSTDTPKFEAYTTTDENGVGRLDISSLEKRISPQEAESKKYCQSPLLEDVWFCMTVPEENDHIYFAPQIQHANQNSAETNWSEVRRFNLSKEGIKQGYLEFEDALPNTTYTVRIYDSMGFDHFVKRVIGLPGDTIKIENGLVYLQKESQGEFIQIEEPYLNQENANQTYVTNTDIGNTFVVPTDKYFVLGDNRNRSNDSRAWQEPITQAPYSFVPEANIDGKVLMILLPLADIRFIPSAEY